jgi:DNA-binding response OmpR family regulator
MKKQKANRSGADEELNPQPTSTATLISARQSPAPKPMKTVLMFDETSSTTQANIRSKAKPEPRNVTARKRLLIADDDGSIRESLARVLEGENYEVLLAKSGQEAVSQFLYAEPDLVLLDLNMPGKDGWQAFELMEKVRPFVPVIVITARPNQFEHAAKLGIDALMEKPLDLPLLLRTIKGLLAEPERARIARLTQRNFTTFLLLRKDTAKPAERRNGFSTAPLASDRKQVEPIRPSRPGKRRIMVAEDDTSVSASLGRVLEAENYDVVFARDGYEAATKYLTAPFDLALLDLNLPRMDGWQAYDWISKLHPLVPIIIITARPNEYERAVAAGADALMEKPLDLPLLLKTIKELLAESPQQRIAHLTSRDFSTRFLSRSGDDERRGGQ